MKTYRPSSDPHVGEQMDEEMARSATNTGRSTLHTGGTQIVGGGNGDGPGPQVMAADTLEGDSVVNRQGEKLGEIRDIMIDVPSGRVGYAVLSSGGFLGMGDKLFAIPWNAFTQTASDLFSMCPKSVSTPHPASTRITGPRWPISAGERRSILTMARSLIGKYEAEAAGTMK